MARRLLIIEGHRRLGHHEIVLRAHLHTHLCSELRLLTRHDSQLELDLGCEHWVTHDLVVVVRDELLDHRQGLIREVRR